MSRTYKDLPYRVKLDRYGVSKKNPVEERVIDTSVSKRIVGIFFAHEISEMEEFENRVLELNGEFKKHEVTGSLVSIRDFALTKHEMQIESHRNPLFDYIHADRLRVSVSGTDFPVEAEFNKYGPIGQKLLRFNFSTNEYKEHVKRSKTNIFNIYEATVSTANIWGVKSVVRSEETKEATPAVASKIWNSGCSCCNYSGSDSAETHQKEILARAVLEHNTLGEILDETEDKIFATPSKIVDI